jgi:Scavenger mRNA decapping enzyme C-term binding
MLEFQKGVLFPSPHLGLPHSPLSCLFCRILARTEPDAAPLVYEDSVVACFHPRTPDTANPRHHWLVVPKAHVSNTSSFQTLTARSEIEGAATLLRHMRNVGRELRMRQENPDHPMPVPPAWLAEQTEQWTGGELGFLRRTKEEAHAIVEHAVESGAPAPSLRAGVVDAVFHRPADDRADGRALLADDHVAEVDRGTSLGFHAAPFNSINHLHLHVMHGECRNWKAWISHAAGFPWHLPVDSFLASLDARAASAPE